ncbi:MAG: YfhO family protein [Acidobacteriota bacterium]
MALRRRRPLLTFQVLVDVLLVALLGRHLLMGLHLGPGVEGSGTWGAPRTMAGSPEQTDLPLQFDVWWSEVRRLVVAGEPPWISDRIGGGVPLYANGQTGLPFPLQLPVWVLGPERGSDVMAVWKLELAALGGFLFLSRLGARPAAAALSSVAYGFGLYSLSWLVVPLAWVVSATPWCFWLLVGALRGRRRDAGLLAVVLGVLAGWSVHPESASFLWLAVIGLGSMLAWGRWRRVGRLAAPLACAVGVAGIGALPTITTLRESSKYIASHEQAAYPLKGLTWTLRAEVMALAVVPWRDGHPARGGWHRPFANAAVAVSVGAAALTLSLVAPHRRRHRRDAAALVALAALSACLVWQLPGPAQLLARLPVIGLMTWSRAGFLLAFALATLAGLATDAWLRRPRRGRLIKAVMVVEMGVVVLAATAPSRVPPSTVWGMAWAPAAVAVAAIAVPLLGGWPLVAIAAAELGVASWGMIPFAANQQPSRLIQTVEELARDEGGRVIGLGDALPPNLAAVLGLNDLRANDPMRPAGLARLHQALGSGGLDLPGPVTQPWAGLTGAWGVRWLLTPPDGVTGPSSPGWREVYRDGDGRIYRNDRTLPVVRLAGRTAPVPPDVGEGGCEGTDFATTALTNEIGLAGGRGSLEVVEERPWRVRAHVRSVGPVLAVLHVPRAPGWRATLDGRPAALHTADLAAMGVAVPDGKHDVCWSYEPPGLAAGAAMTLAGLVGCVILGLGGWRRRAT